MATSTKPKSKKKDGIETTQEVPVETNETATTTPITEVQITEVPINNETATKIFAAAPSTFKACVKKNRA